MTPREGILWLASVAAALLSCTTLPDYAAPTGAILAPGSADQSDVITYRTLTRADFKSANPPAQFADFAGQIGAATCGYLVAAPGARFINRPIHPTDATAGYEATPQGLHYRAQMDRRCSWWNPRDLGLPPEYILEHEQIHFALFELGARELNLSIAAEVRATGPNAEAATALAQRQLDALVRARLSSVLARSRDFDEDTSLGHKPEAQKRWLATVRAELEATAERSSLAGFEDAVSEELVDDGVDRLAHRR